MLIFKEGRKVVFSAVWFLVIAALWLMIYSQGVLTFTENDKIEKPQESQANYGRKVSKDKDIIMNGAINALYQEYKFNHYTTYPVGFYKEVRLNEKGQEEIGGILSMISGIDKKEIEEAKAGEEMILKRADSIIYEEFASVMKRVDRILGGGSNYSEGNLYFYGYVDKTYEEALEEYEIYVENGDVVGLHGRLFMDYACIVLSVLPVFLGVYVSFKDRQGKVFEILYTKRISSARLIITRYFVVVLSVLIPFLIMTFWSAYSVWKLYAEVNLNYFTPFLYALGWGLPSILISAAAGMFLTELTNTPIAILVQGLWWYVDINMGMRIGEKYPITNLIPRHNSLGHSEVFSERFLSLAINRTCFTIVSLLLIGITIIVYEQKRRGKLHGITIKRSVKNS